MKNKKLRSLVMKDVFSNSNSFGAIIVNFNGTTYCYDNTSSQPLRFYAKDSSNIKDWSYFLNKSPSYNDGILSLDFKDDLPEIGYSINVYFLPSGADIFNSKLGIDLYELQEYDLTPTNISTHNPCPEGSYGHFYNGILIDGYNTTSPDLNVENINHNGQTFNGIGGDIRLFIELKRAYSGKYLGSFYI